MENKLTIIESNLCLCECSCGNRTVIPCNAVDKMRTCGLCLVGKVKRTGDMDSVDMTICEFCTVPESRKSIVEYIHMSFGISASAIDVKLKRLLDRGDLVKPSYGYYQYAK